MNEVPEDAGEPSRDTLPGQKPHSLPALVLHAPPPASPATGFALGSAAARERLTRRPVWLALALATALVVVGAIIERRAGSLGATTRALHGLFRLVLPLTVFALVGEAFARGKLSEATWQVSRFGVPKRDVAVGLIATTAAVAAAAGAVLAVLSVLVAHASGAGIPLAKDVFASGWIGALTAMAYVAYFSLGSTFFARGRGRSVVLFLDFAASGQLGLMGALFPRGHALNLLGGGAPLALPQASSSVLLVLAFVAFGIAAALRSGD